VLLSLLTRAIDEHKQGVALASLERIVQLCTGDVKELIKTDDKIPAFELVVGAMNTFKESLLAQAIGACAIAALTFSRKHSPPKRLVLAALDAETVPILVHASQVLGPSMDQPCKEALTNMVKNAPDLAKLAADQGGCEVKKDLLSLSF
jgi:hypothetical protein